jgi:hypothetical protein
MTKAMAEAERDIARLRADVRRALYWNAVLAFLVAR